MPYRALDIAKYIIQRCALLGAPVSNLKLQKILYFTLGEYYQKTGHWLFDDTVYAWRLGPVVRSVYDEYSPYGASPIYDTCDIDIPPNVANTMNETIDFRRRQTAGELVQDAHKTGGAWASVYNGSMFATIPKSKIAKEFQFPSRREDMWATTHTSIVNMI